MFFRTLWIGVFVAWSAVTALAGGPSHPSPGLQYFDGPDAEGWYYIDSREPDGPSFQYLWISTPTQITGDDEGAWLPLPFPFSYRGQVYDSVFVCTNGFISFTSASTNPNNTPVPNPTAPNAAVYVYWDDLVVEPGFSAIDTGTVGVAPNRRFVIRWYRPKHYPNDYRVADFQVVLYEAGEKVLINIKQAQFNMPAFDNGASATIGMENADGSVGLLYSYNDTTRVEDYLAILFYRPDSVWNVAPVALEAPADNQPVGVAEAPRAWVANVGTESGSFYTVLALYPYETPSPVYRDSVFVSHLAPGDTVQVTLSPWTPSTAGRYRAVLYTRLANDEHRENDTLQQGFVAGTPGTDFLVLDLNPLQTDGRRVYEVLEQAGHTGWYATSIAYFDSLSAYTTVWCLLGVYPNKHILTVYQALKLRDYLETGGRVLLQSGDAFGEDPTRDTLGPYFGINTRRTTDGSTPVGILYGLDNPLVPEITAADTWAYYGGREHLDSLVLQTPTDAQVAPVMKISHNSYTLVAYHGTRWNAAVSTVELTPVEVEEGLWNRNTVDQRLITGLMDFLTGDLYTYHDVTVLGLWHPPAEALPAGDTVRFRVAVANSGTYSETTVPVKVAVYQKSGRTGGLAASWVLLHADTTEIPILAPGDTVVVTFDPWVVPDSVDTLLLVAQSQLPGDGAPENDSLAREVRTYLVPGDLLRVIRLDHRTGNAENYGVGFDGTYFYVTTQGAGSDFLVVLDDTGGVVATLGFPATGYRDLEVWREPGDTVAWMYAGSGSALHRLRLQGFHSLTLETTWGTPVDPVQGVALDPERQRYFVASGYSPIVEMNRQGAVLSHIVPGRQVYGLAYVPPLRGWWDAHLWISAALNDTIPWKNRLYRWNLATHTLEDSLIPAVPDQITATYPGGLSHRMVYHGRQVLVELVQAEPTDYLQVLYLGDASWDRKCGDANNDGYATWSDFDALSRYLFLGDTLAQPLALDVNEDYHTDPLDLRYLARFLWDEADSLYCRQNSR